MDPSSIEIFGQIWDTYADAQGAGGALLHDVWFIDDAFGLVSDVFLS
jgi:hypothetical protein